jgi:serine/threonine protein kinase
VERARVSARSTPSAHGGAEPLASAAASSTGVVAWYAQGFSDQLGDRLLLFDNSGAAPLELLRLAQRLTDAPGFEPALRERVEELKPFRHPAFARIRGVNVLAEPTAQLALVSEHIPGQRLSEILRAARAAGFKPDPGTALWLVRQLMPAVAALHEMGAGIAHGTLSPDRIVVTPTGDLVITEYVFAQAIDQMGARPSELWRDLGVAVSPESGRVDRRGDIEQVALLALTVLLGRPLRPDEYPARVRQLLTEACDPQRWSLVPPLRTWLSRALRLHGSFSSAVEALDTLDELLPRVTGMWAARLLPQNVGTVPAEATPRITADPHLLPRSSERRDPASSDVPSPGHSASQGRPSTPRQSVAPATRRILDFEDSRVERVAESAGNRELPHETRRLWRLCFGLAGIALVEAISLAFLLGRPSVAWLRAIETAVPAVDATSSSSAPITGWISIVSPIDIDVHVDGHLLAGGTDVRLPLTSGTHDVILTSERHGVRSVQRITVAPGKVLSLRPGVIR